MPTEVALTCVEEKVFPVQTAECFSFSWCVANIYLDFFEFTTVSWNFRLFTLFDKKNENTIGWFQSRPDLSLLVYPRNN